MRSVRFVLLLCIGAAIADSVPEYANYTPTLLMQPNAYLFKARNVSQSVIWPNSRLLFETLKRAPSECSSFPELLWETFPEHHEHIIYGIKNSAEGELRWEFYFYVLEGTRHDKSRNPEDLLVPPIDLKDFMRLPATRLGPLANHAVLTAATSEAAEVPTEAERNATAVSGVVPSWVRSVVDVDSYIWSVDLYDTPRSSDAMACEASETVRCLASDAPSTEAAGVGPNIHIYYNNHNNDGSTDAVLPDGTRVWESVYVCGSRAVSSSPEVIRKMMVRAGFAEDLLTDSLLQEVITAYTKRNSSAGAHCLSRKAPSGPDGFPVIAFVWTRVPWADFVDMVATRSWPTTFHQFVAKHSEYFAEHHSHELAEAYTITPDGLRFLRSAFYGNL